MPDWKGAGLDKRHGFWVESFRAVHEVLATVFNECIEVGWRGGEGEGVSGWLVEERTILVIKDSKKGTEVGKLQTNCLPQLDIEASEENKLLPEEQKGSRRKYQGMKDQLPIDRCIFQNCREKRQI